MKTDYKSQYETRTRMYDELVEENGKLLEKLEMLHRDHNSALGALGYPIPPGTPEGKYRCGLCDGKEADYKLKNVEYRELFKIHKMTIEAMANR